MAMGEELVYHISVVQSQFYLCNWTAGGGHTSQTPVLRHRHLCSGRPVGTVALGECGSQIQVPQASRGPLGRELGLVLSMWGTPRTPWGGSVIFYPV